MVRVSYNWLQEYLEIDLSPRELADRLTMAGLEVEALENFCGRLDHLVAGLVLTVERHPDAAQLFVARVDTGDSPLTVVCGAPNIRAGQLVPLALPGALLPGSLLPLQPVEIRGILSQGMVCSAAELKLELAHAKEGILELDSSAAPGSRIDRLLELDDWILHLALTPNRADCLGMIGVAYEVAALTGRQLKLPSETLQEAAAETARAVRVTVQEAELCPRYTVRIINGVTVGPAPLWMQLRLLKAGIRPINNVVDITNYVMWQYGQPLHAFDYDLLEGSEIVVRRALRGEKLVTLDGVERLLDEEVLVIADSRHPVGLAGVMGGESTEISATTKRILLEAALFDPVTIRRTARRYALPSEASQRFERGVNPDFVPLAQDSASRFIAELAGGEILKGAIDLYPFPRRPRRLIVRPHRINEILGVKIGEKRVCAILESLGFAVERRTAPYLEVTVPQRRGDVTIEEDLVEEVARLYGYDHIPTTLPRGELVESRELPEKKIRSLISESLRASGFFEAINLSFISRSELLKIGFPEDDPRFKAIPLKNPLSEEQGVMRTTLLPGLLKTVCHNFNFQEVNQLFFELGKVFTPHSLPLEELPGENERLALAATGVLRERSWLTPPAQANFFFIKGVLEKIFQRLGLTDVSFVAAHFPYLHPTRAARIVIAGEDAGFLGQLHPAVAEKYDFQQPVTVCELQMEQVEANANLLPRYRTLSRYPASLRDIAVVVAPEITAGDLERCIRAAGGDLVEEVALFDLYQGDQIAAGKRSLAFSITYRSRERTLTDEEISAAHQRVAGALARKGAELRK